MFFRIILRNIPNKQKQQAVILQHKAKHTLATKHMNLVGRW